MMAAVSREDAKSVWVTGSAGALVIVIAIVMMVLSAPSRPQQRPHGSAVQTAQTVSQVTVKRAG
jgi:hypothetical protein